MDLGDERRQFARLDRIVRHVCRDDIGGEFDKIRGGGFRHMFDSKLRGGEALFSKSGAHKNKSDGLCRRPWQNQQWLELPMVPDLQLPVLLDGPNSRKLA